MLRGQIFTNLTRIQLYLYGIYHAVKNILANSQTILYTSSLKGLVSCVLFSSVLSSQCGRASYVTFASCIRNNQPG